jgi:hypothetical protein
VRSTLVSVFIGLTLPAGGIWADATVEGVVELPKPTNLQPLNQRYRSEVEVPVAPTDPPIAVVYLAGDFAGKNNANSSAQMTQKNIAFKPDLLAIQVGTAVDFPNLDDTYHNVWGLSP